jgi:hypothetical protein
MHGTPGLETHGVLRKTSPSLHDSSPQGQRAFICGALLVLTRHIASAIEFRESLRRCSRCLFSERDRLNACSLSTLRAEMYKPEQRPLPTVTRELAYTS